jgi:hypothetical protein
MTIRMKVERGTAASVGSGFVFSGGSPPSMSRGLRIEAAASYSGLSPFFIESLIRDGSLPAIGGPGSGVCAACVILREHLDDFLTELGEAAVERA